MCDCTSCFFCLLFQAARAEGAALAAESRPASLVKSEDLSAAAGEPAEKKRKSAAEGGAEGEEAALARQVDALRTEAARLAQERDAALLASRHVTEVRVVVGSSFA
jgi:hypothetical protein